VRLLTPLRRARTTATAVGAALLVALPVGLPSLTLSAAHASPGDPAAQVSELLAKVHRLQARAKAAEHRYSATISGVARSVNTSIDADQAATDAQIRAANAQVELYDRVRGLYESGGPLASYAAVLDSGSVTSAFDRNEMVSRVVTAQVAGVNSILREATAAQQAADAAEKVERAKIHAQRSVADVANHVQALLEAQRALLKQADQRLAAVRAAEAALQAQSADFSSITNDAIANLRILAPSSDYLSLYRSAAGNCSGLSWTVLAAIGQIESGHGRNNGPSSAGAMGPMQFMPATFEHYAVDGNHDGVANIEDPADAIYTAANYLCANGAGRGPSALNAAIFHYNHAGWYVAMVLKLAGMYAAQYT
jgi:membrane-bound lytic murein transglycosylase B